MDKEDILITHCKKNLEENLKEIIKNVDTLIPDFIGSIDQKKRTEIGMNSVVTMFIQHILHNFKPKVKVFSLIPETAMMKQLHLIRGPCEVKYEDINRFDLEVLKNWIDNCNKSGLMDAQLTTLIDDQSSKINLYLLVVQDRKRINLNEIILHI
jgi:hypothetical protein